MLIGVIGKANVGKSTFFKALTLADAQIANYPFTTIKPNRGIAYTKVKCACKDFKVACQPIAGSCINGTRFVPIEMLDVAGLVPGAHLGKGRGNQFLDDLRQADCLIHVVDISGSTNEQGEVVEPLSHDPAYDVRWLEEEIDLWFLGLLEKNWTKFARAVQQEQRQVAEAIAKQFSGLGITEQLVKDMLAKLGLSQKGLPDWSPEELRGFAHGLRIASKPMIIAANKADVTDAEKNIHKVNDEFPGHAIIACSAESELALREAAKHGLISYFPGDKSFDIAEPDKLSDKQKAALEFIRNNVLGKLGVTGLQKVLDAVVFDILGLIAVFPVANSKLTDSKGKVLPECFLVPKGITAKEFAYKVHTDLGEKFIRAVDLRTKKTVGKDHILQHLDVIEIVAAR